MPISPELIEEQCSPAISLFLFFLCLCMLFIFNTVLVQNQTWKLSGANCVDEITLKRGLWKTYSLSCCYGYLQSVPEPERLHHQQRVGKAQLQPELPAESRGTAESDKRRRQEKKRWEVFAGESCLQPPVVVPTAVLDVTQPSSCAFSCPSGVFFWQLFCCWQLFLALTQQCAAYFTHGPLQVLIVYFSVCF